MTDFIAYHSTERMGYRFEPSRDFHFFSRKPESFLRSAIGSRVWTICGTRDRKRRMVYHLAGVFTPSEVQPEANGFGITGKGTPFRPPINVTFEPWFLELLREQNNFSFGFSSIRGESIIAELQRVRREHEQKTKA